MCDGGAYLEVKGQLCRVSFFIFSWVLRVGVKLPDVQATVFSC